MNKPSGSTTIRISRKTHEELKELSRQQSQSIQSVIEAALERYRQNIMLSDLNADYSALRKNKKAWKAELGERALWEKTLKDGLRDD